PHRDASCSLPGLLLQRRHSDASPGCIMGSIVKFGCLGIIVIAVVIGVLAAVAGNQPKPQQQVTGQTATGAEKGGAKPELAKVGQTASLGGWEVTLMDFGPYERFAQS